MLLGLHHVKVFFTNSMELVRAIEPKLSYADNSEGG